MYSRLSAKTRGASRHLANAEDIEAIWAHRSGSEALGTERSCYGRRSRGPVGGVRSEVKRVHKFESRTQRVGFLRQCKRPWHQFTGGKHGTSSNGRSLVKSPASGTLRLSWRR